MNISIPFLFTNKKIVNHEKIPVYIALKYFCEQSENDTWLIDYKKLNKLTELSIPVISRAISYFYRLRLIDLRGEKGRKRVSILEVPENLQNEFAAKWAEVILFDEQQELNKQIAIPPEKILNS